MVPWLNPSLEEGAAASEHFSHFFAFYFWRVSDVLGTHLPLQKHLFPLLFSSQIFLFGGAAAKASQEELPEAQAWEWGCRNPSGETICPFPSRFGFVTRAVFALTADTSCRGCLTCWEGFIPNNFQTLLPSWFIPLRFRSHFSQFYLCLQESLSILVPFPLSLSGSHAPCSPNLSSFHIYFSICLLLPVPAALSGFISSLSLICLGVQWLCFSFFSRFLGQGLTVVFAEGKWEGRGKEGGEGLGPAPILTAISRDQQLVGHNIFQCLIHISTAPLAATQMLYPKKGEFWITLKPLALCASDSVGSWCSSGFSASAEVGGETSPCLSFHFCREK